VLLRFSRPGDLDGHYVFVRLMVGFERNLPSGQEARGPQLTVKYEPGVVGFYFWPPS
jgi:hypothetical protein